MIVHGVEVVYGLAAAKRWRAALAASGGLQLTDAQVSRIWEELRRAAAKTDAREAEAGPRPPTLAQIYWTGAGSLVAGLSAVLASGYAYDLTGSLWGWAGGMAVLIILGLLARRSRWLRLPAVAWLTGLGCTTAAVLALTIYHYVT